MIVKDNNRTMGVGPQFGGVAMHRISGMVGNENIGLVSSLPEEHSVAAIPVAGRGAWNSARGNRNLKRLELQRKQPLKGESRVSSVRPLRPRLRGCLRQWALDEKILGALRKDLLGGAYAERKHAALTRCGLPPGIESIRGEAIIFFDKLSCERFHPEQCDTQPHGIWVLRVKRRQSQFSVWIAQSTTSRSAPSA
jgi:hypothetical protein